MPDVGKQVGRGSAMLGALEVAGAYVGREGVRAAWAKAYAGAHSGSS